MSGNRRMSHRSWWSSYIEPPPFWLTWSEGCLRPLRGSLLELMAGVQSAELVDEPVGQACGRDREVVVAAVQGPRAVVDVDSDIWGRQRIHEASGAGDVHDDVVGAVHDVDRDG